MFDGDWILYDQKQHSQLVTSSTSLPLPLCNIISLLCLPPCTVVFACKLDKVSHFVPSALPFVSYVEVDASGDWEFEVRIGPRQAWNSRNEFERTVMKMIVPQEQVRYLKPRCFIDELMEWAGISVTFDGKDPTSGPYSKAVRRRIHRIRSALLPDIFFNDCQGWSMTGNDAYCSAEGRNHYYVFQFWTS